LLTDIPRDSLWDLIFVMRKKATFTGNRFEYLCGGVNFTIQRRGRRVYSSSSKKLEKLSDTWIAREDFGWVVVVLDFNFQTLSSMNPPRHHLECSFKGDFERFQKDFVYLKLFDD
jgi:hypothetical protein